MLETVEVRHGAVFHSVLIPTEQSACTFAVKAVLPLLVEKTTHGIQTLKQDSHCRAVFSQPKRAGHYENVRLLKLWPKRKPIITVVAQARHVRFDSWRDCVVDQSETFSEVSLGLHGSAAEIDESLGVGESRGFFERAVYVERSKVRILHCCLSSVFAKNAGIRSGVLCHRVADCCVDHLS